VYARQAIINETRPRRCGVKTIYGPFVGPAENYTTRGERRTRTRSTDGREDLLTDRPLRRVCVLCMLYVHRYYYYYYYYYVYTGIWVPVTGVRSETIISEYFNTNNRVYIYIKILYT